MVNINLNGMKLIELLPNDGNCLTVHLVGIYPVFKLILRLSLFCIITRIFKTKDLVFTVGTMAGFSANKLVSSA